MTPILLDTSAWIAYFRRAGWTELKTAVQRALRDGQVATCWPVRTELLVGARDEHDFARLDRLLSGLPQVRLTDSLWREAASLGHRLRAAGVSVPLPDLLISQAALTADAELWHIDQHYERIREQSSLRTLSFLDPQEADGTKTPS